MTEKQSDNNAEAKKEGAKKRGVSKVPFILIGLLVVIGALWFLFGKGFAPRGDAALVNGEPITRAEYNERVQFIEEQYELEMLMSGMENPLDNETKTQIKNMALAELIDTRLFLQAARESNVTVSDAEINERLALEKGAFPDDASFEEALSMSGMTEEKLRGEIREHLTIVAYAKSVLPESEYTVTDAEIEEYYTANYGEAVESGNPMTPTLEEFAQTSREQLELQKLGVAAGKILEGLRARATIEILVDLPGLTELTGESSTAEIEVEEEGAEATDSDAEVSE